ncbi:hypothetical protein K491DRAFT_607077 [Lophiostoma macrostomum CBS 122681]|uniref:LsmAD domain-containing protein n=1 Tax=Lophiostoma macrostomum CBS 122681 TaxID=1314788 RepID=A0A6A6SWJ8_9PLEO|nr:hypothetical protein K491DRAFT_607077 [Lophiostoma macrostomum CBS 122681]
MSTAKGSDNKAGSPTDGGPRKPPAAQKAWTQGTNPIIQRPSNPNSSNGVVNTPKPAQNPSSLPSESASPMRHLNDRMMYLLANLHGLPSNITLKNGEKYTGVLSGTSLDPTEMRYVFKMVKRVQPATESQVNGASETLDDYVGQGDDNVMSFDIGDVADFHVANVVLDKSQSKGQNGITSGFRTDTDISGNAALRERNLQKWEPSADTNVNMSLEDTGRSSKWDQFSTNEQLFGVKSNYDESYYTTTIDRSNPQYAERAARAEKIAREIESSSALNAHVREERGHSSNEDKGVDEEERYSGVRREFPPLGGGGPNKYTPPARRPPTGQPTVPGAPVDPAIISSQLARPDSGAKGGPRTISPSADKQLATEPLKAEATSKPDTTLPSRPAPSQDGQPRADGKTTPLAKLGIEQAQKPSAALKPSVGGIPARKPGRPDNATANVEHDLLDSFKQFSAAEKLRLSERQRSLARESKAVKLNDLKKFSQNFKLNTSVPKDLLPILAKDETKQQQILEKARRVAEDAKSTPTKASPVAPDAQVPARITASKPEPAHASPTSTVDRQQNQRPRPGPSHYGSASVRDRTGPAQNINSNQKGLLSTRLAYNQQQHKQQGGVPYNGIPHPIPIQDMRIPPPTGPSATSSGVQTPTSSISTKFNVRAHEFKPNPAANTFQPGGNPSANSSPRPDSAASRPEPPQPRKPHITSFFGGQRPSVEPWNLSESFNVIKRMLKDSQGSDKGREHSNNGGIPVPYRTPPTWDYPVTNKDRGYVEMFDRSSGPPPVSAPHNVMSNGQMPHQHQLPPHLQTPHSMQGPTPQHTPRHPPAQPHHGQGGPPHFEGHNMQFSHSTSSVHPSPRNMPGYMYTTQPQGMPGFPQQMPVQSFGMSPNVQHASLRGGGQFVNAPMPGMGGQMMTNQPSNGPFMGMPANPQMHMYSPGPGQAYPHFPGQMPGPPGPGGYPSPRPGAPMMHHQGSQQGHQQAQQHIVYMPQGAQGPPMYAQMAPGSMTPMRQQYPQPHQTHYGSPHQNHQFPQAHRGTPSGSYSQPMMQQHSLPPQGPPPTGPANHAPEVSEEVK